jgi:inorganic pyrophosphatase
METIDIVIETPKGSAQKYDYDPELRFFRLKKIMPLGMVFPYDFGFIPGTKGEDGDPLDILILSEFPTFPGCLMDCRVIGGIKARQKENDGEEVRNDRFIAVPVRSLVYEDIREISDLQPKIPEQIQQFFINYNELAGKMFTPHGFVNSEEAMKIIADAKEA